MMTAEEFINCEQYWRVIPNYDTLNAMIEFATMHVKAALEEASKADVDDVSFSIRSSMIKNSYPLSNIK